MNEVKVNGKTGQVAVITEGTGPLASRVHVYDPGGYKINYKTGQVAVLGPSGQYEVMDLAPDQVAALSSPEALLRKDTGGIGMISEGTPITSQGESAIRGLQQGVTFGTSDEIAGATHALLAGLTGEKVPNQQNPVTGEMGGAGQAYLRGAYEDRERNKAAKDSNPRTFKGALYGGALLPSMAMPANTLAQAGASGAAQGGLLGLGMANTEDPAALLKSGGIGAAGGATLGLLMKGLYDVAFTHNSPTGLAYAALDESTPGGIMNMRVRPGSAPAELDPAMANNLRGAASMNSAAAGEAIPAARARMENVNNAIINEIGNRLSPEDAAAAQIRLVQEAQARNQAAYHGPGGAYSNPARVGLTPEITQRPSFQEALGAVEARAADEWPPRNVDPTDLGALDIDLIDRALQQAQHAATTSHGDTSAAALAAQARIPTRGEVAGAVRGVADQAFPELATARAGAAESFGVEQALETSRRWIRSNVSPEQVGAEFAAMSPQEQQVAVAGIATDIRNILNTKTARANLGQVFDRLGIAEKLRNIGVADEFIDRVVAGGQGARSVLDALEGGSMTARNLAFKDAMEPTFNQVKSGDLVAGAVMNSPAVTLALPILRGVGDRAKQGAAAEIIQALTTPGSAGITGLINRAPQTWGGLLNAPFRTGGALLGTEFAVPR
jgi:hypothetical protein